MNLHRSDLRKANTGDLKFTQNFFGRIFSVRTNILDTYIYFVNLYAILLKNLIYIFIPKSLNCNGILLYFIFILFVDI